jgi:hypothetical protein
MKIPDNSFLVFAANLWNASGISLVGGKRYEVKPLCSGEFVQKWQDSWITCGPEGWEGSIGKFSSHMLSALLRVRELGGTPQRYFALIGCVGKSLQHAFLIGNGCEIVPLVDGELFAFANDAEVAYGNNHGQIVVTVREIT